jgi:hypothetical protein
MIKSIVLNLKWDSTRKADAEALTRELKEIEDNGVRHIISVSPIEYAQSFGGVMQAKKLLVVSVPADTD